MCDHTFSAFENHQFRGYSSSKWAVSLVIANGPFIHPQLTQAIFIDKQVLVAQLVCTLKPWHRNGHICIRSALMTTHSL